MSEHKIRTAVPVTDPKSSVSLPKYEESKRSRSFRLGRRDGIQEALDQFCAHRNEVDDLMLQRHEEWLDGYHAALNHVINRLQSIGVANLRKGDEPWRDITSDSRTLAEPEGV